MKPTHKSTPSGDSDKPRTFPSADRPRTFPSSNKPRTFPVTTEQGQEQKDVQQDTIKETPKIEEVKTIKETPKIEEVKTIKPN